MVQIAPSLLAADFKQIAKELEKITKAGAEYLHLDVMDGIFVSNISFGIPVIASLRSGSSLFFDVHLMIEDPLQYVQAFVDAGADAITFHLESKSDPRKTIDAIRKTGIKAGMTIKPGTPVETLLPFLEDLDMVLIMSVEPGFGGQPFLESCLPKIRFLREHAPNLDISVDGGINKETGKLVREAGANILVAGSYVFGAADVKAAVDSLR